MNTDAQSAGSPELEQAQHNHTTAAPRSRSRSHARCSLGSVGLFVARCRVARAAAPRCSRLLAAAQCCAHRSVHAPGPRYARLLESLGSERNIAMVLRISASFVCGHLWLLMAYHGCLRLLAASRRLAPTRAEIARPDGRIASAPLRVAQSCAWSGSSARGWS
jgi:hypothetical protein